MLCINSVVTTTVIFYRSNYSKEYKLLVLIHTFILACAFG